MMVEQRESVTNHLRCFEANLLKKHKGEVTRSLPVGNDRKELPEQGPQKQEPDHRMKVPRMREVLHPALNLRGNSPLFSLTLEFRHPLAPTPVHMLLPVRYVSLLVFGLFGIIGPASVHAQFKDLPFPQSRSIKYELSPELTGAALKKVLVDANDVAYVLTDQGLARSFGTELVPDRMYRPLADRNPLDIALQPGSGYLYYLYEDEWLTNAYAGREYGTPPKGTFSHIRVNQSGQVLLVGNQRTALWKEKAWQEVPTPDKDFLDLKVADDRFFLLGKNAVWAWEDDSWQQRSKGEGLTCFALRENELILGTQQGYYGINARSGEETFPLQTALPVPELTGLEVVHRQIWGLTNQGAFARQPDGTFRYYASKRWLDQDMVIDLAHDSQGNVYLLTPSGLNKIEWFSHTLGEKASWFQDHIRKYHIRYGFIANLLLTRPGDLTSAEMIDTDNDGLWTAFYLGSQALRCATTGEAVARRHAWEAFEAYERLLSINPLRGFSARTFERKGFKYSDPVRWRNSQEDAWEWKGHTSSDEFVGHIFVAAMMHELVAETESERQRIVNFIDPILSHIVRNDWSLVDVDGNPTLWARWHPDFVNGYAPTVFDRRLNSATIMAGLQLGYALTGKELYREKAFELMDKHGYRDNMCRSMYGIRYTEHHYGDILMGTDWNHSDDELAFIMYWVLYHYAFNEELKQEYAAAIREHWEIERPEKNALWNLISYGTCGAMDEEAVKWHLQKFPMDLIRYDVKNSHRKDLAYLPENFRGQYTRELLPPTERPIHRHNANPFVLDGGQGGKTKLAGDEYLLPYWLGRYLGVIEP